METEIKRQELANRLLQREVCYCVCSLMSGLAKMMWEPGFRDAFDCDAEDLSPMFESQDYETPGRAFIEDEADVEQLEEIAEQFGYWSDTLSGCLNANEAINATLRKKIAGSVDDWQWVCENYSIDPNTKEVCEHWIVSDWLASKLKDRGEVVGEFAGLRIWGRTIANQPIAFDWVIQQIACDLWSEEMKL